MMTHCFSFSCISLCPPYLHQTRVQISQNWPSLYSQRYRRPRIHSLRIPCIGIPTLAELGWIIALWTQLWPAVTLTSFQALERSQSVLKFLVSSYTLAGLSSELYMDIMGLFLHKRIEAKSISLLGRKCFLRLVASSVISNNIGSLVTVRLYNSKLSRDILYKSNGHKWLLYQCVNIHRPWI